MNAHSTLPAIGPTRLLRVFGGRLEGAEFSLPTGRRLTMGHALDNDIVIRGRQTRDCRLELVSDGERTRVRLLAGEVHLLGQPLEPGRPILLPAFVPLTIGEYRFAVGEEGHERWSEVGRLAGAMVAEEAASAPVETGPRAGAEKVRRQARALTRYLPRWLISPATLVGAALLLVGILALDPIRDFAMRGMDSPEAARGVLVAGGFSGVTAAVDPADGVLVFTGSVPDGDRLAQLRDLAAERFPGARIEVDTDAALARAADDILAAEGIDAQARSTGAGVLTIASEYLPSDRLEELRKRLKTDLPALRRTRFVLTGERGPADLAYFFNSAKYGLATFVDGDPGYLVTADGSYWFEGAILPTGHEIVSVRNGRVILRRNGLVEQLVIAPGMSAGGGTFATNTSDDPSFHPTNGDMP